MTDVQGTTAPGFEALRDTFAATLRKRPGGAAVAAYHRGRRVVDLWAGARDESGAPWGPDTACVCYSTTKGVVATALHVLVDRGVLDYDDPVVAHWPEFGAAGKESITVRDVLAHRAGLFDVRALVADARELLDWDHMTGALAAATPQPPPRGHSAYQALTWGYLVGEIMRRASGREVPELVRTELAAPLGIDRLHVGAPEGALDDVARLVGSPARSTGGPSPRRRAAQRRQQRVFRTAEKVLRRFGHPIDLRRAAAALGPEGISSFDFSSDEVLQACIPAANGLFSARALSRLYAALAGGGALDGVRILSPETLSRATAIQVRGFDQVTLFRMRWRLGYHRVQTLRGVLPRGFGHFGWGGSGAWADPGRELSFAYVVNTGTGTPIGDLRISRLSTRLVHCADRA